MTATLDPPKVWVIEPVTIGPTWTKNEAWDGTDPLSEYILPTRTLGWQVIFWCHLNLRDDEGNPWTFTREQTRFILWWYAVDSHGRFAYRKGVLQRLKGWGKDPIAAAISVVELVGPSRFSHWATEDDVAVYGVRVGEPVGVRHPRAWIQIAAVSKDQTRNTMTLFPGLISKECIEEHDITIGKEIIYAHGGACRIEAVTSSPRALEGGRPTFVVKNETHHWLLNNEGHAMADVIDRNATKAKGGAARSLSITNAYEPSEDSEAQREREAYEDEASGLSVATGVLYDSLEAPPEASMRPPKARKSDPDPTDDEIKAYLSAIIAAVRGDAGWLDVESIVKSILDRRNAPSKSRRFWFNQIVASEDAWAQPAAVDAAMDPLCEQARRDSSDDILRAGWLLMPGEEIVLFFDGSKSDDDTGLMGCRISDGQVFTFGHWAKPRGDRGLGWTVPRHEVDNRAIEVHERYRVVGFFADPSHAQDEDSGRYWDATIDGWHRRWKDQYQIWAVRTGDRQHSVMWDMTSPQRSAEFTAAAELFIEELESFDEMAQRYTPKFRHDGHPALVKHMKNARRYPNKYGVSLWKGHRESSSKIDLAVCAVGARMMYRLILNKGMESEDEGGEVWW